VKTSTETAGNHGLRRQKEQHCRTPTGRTLHSDPHIQEGMMPTRRWVVKGLAGTALCRASGIGAAAAQPAPPPGKIYVRRDIHSLSGNDLAGLRAGVAAMKARPPDDPTSWLFQANIHGTPDPIPPPFDDVLASCQHGSFFFLSWHRIYLFYFERILRASAGSGHPDFALPYWNYGVPAQRSLPDAFRNPATANNPLFVAERRSSVNAGQPVPPSATLDTQAMATTNFASPQGSGQSFGGQTLTVPAHFSGPHGRLESQPHDVMHVAVGGSGWMSDPDMAARDPIFWLHHCNIDRLWTRWIGLGGGRRDPTTNPVWMNTKFTFYDEKAKKVMLAGAEILDTQRQLNYRYDDMPVLAASAAPTEAEAASVPEPTRVLASLPPTESSVGLTSRDSTLTLQPVSAGATESAAAQGSGPVVLSFDNISYRRPVGVYYELYLNKPADVPPDPFGPYYAGNLSLFGLGHAHGDQGVTGGRVALDVTATLARQRELGIWSGGPIKIDLHPSQVEPTEAAQAGPLASIGQVRLLGR
jgi:Common central domain of tyrosinase/Polyphenol oxidase middle domain